MYKFKDSGKTVGDLRNGDEVIVIYKGLPNKTVICLDLIDYMDDVEPYIETLFVSEVYAKKRVDVESIFDNDIDDTAYYREEQAILGVKTKELKLYEMLDKLYLFADEFEDGDGCWFYV